MGPTEIFILDLMNSSMDSTSQEKSPWSISSNSLRDLTWGPTRRIKEFRSGNGVVLVVGDEGGGEKGELLPQGGKVKLRLVVELLGIEEDEEGVGPGGLLRGEVAGDGAVVEVDDARLGSRLEGEELRSEIGVGVGGGATEEEEEEDQGRGQDGSRRVEREGGLGVGTMNRGNRR
ncbi:hypothetical protein CRG98_005787 [Punica granatum]|uniref:Uncharacterized protein n=1 Tax=Punica granatum TaxID=22663 RepID=A0A2I0KZP3_PUNGR|nr:hypothetical protein CRG98_005787 [Punica granatum]